MKKFSKHKKQRIRKLRKQKEEERKERRRLKALLKPLRKLETNLHNYVNFMEVYDGYIGDFTGQVIPEKPVDNPFAIINKMKLIFPHQNSLTDDQKELYIRKISEAFNRMGFYLDLIGKTKLPEMYELLLYHFENPPEQGFDILTSVNFKGITLEIERIEFEDNYF
jgi:hypothetical protein